MTRNAFVLDFDFLEEQNITLNEFIALVHIEKGSVPYVGEVERSLQSKQFIKITEDNEMILREKGKIFMNLVKIEKVPIRKSTKIVPNSEFEEFILEYRLLWKGLKAGSMGARQSCIDKMTRWMEENPTYTKDEILKAAKLYLSTVDNVRFLQRADFFIFKQEENKEECSRLSAFIEDIDDKPVEDWTQTLI